MSEKEKEKKEVFKSKTGAEISEKMLAFFKKYSIPERINSDFGNKNQYGGLDPLLIFDGQLPYADKRNY